MAQTSLDILITNLCVGYLSTPAAVAAGLPAYEDTRAEEQITAGDPAPLIVPRVPIWDTGVETFPAFVVASATEVESLDLRKVTAVITLHARMEAQDAEPKRELYAQWMDALEQHFRNQPVLYDYIAALPEETRTGWALRRIWPGAPMPEIIDAGKALDFLPFTVRFDLRVPKMIPRLV